MTMTPEQLSAMVADREAGTPGPWGMETKRTSCGVCHQIGPWPHKWRAGSDMSACIYDDYPPPGGTDTMIANARRIARVPDMEDTIIAQAAEIARLSDLIPNAAYVAGLEAAIKTALKDAVADGLDPWFEGLRAALSARPTTPDVRVVTDADLREAIGRAWCHEENAAKEMDIDLAGAVLWEIRAIIGETKE